MAKSLKASNSSVDASTDSSSPVDSSPVDSSPAVKTVKIEKLDLKGNGQSFRFFCHSASGKLLSAKINGNWANYHEGQEVPITVLSFLAPATSLQTTRYNGKAHATLDFDLLD